MHSRMRFRVSEFQKILNRAKMESVTSGDRKTVRCVVFSCVVSQRGGGELTMFFSLF